MSTCGNVIRKRLQMQQSKQVNRFSQSIVFSEAIRDSLELKILPDKQSFPRKFREEDIRRNRYHAEREPLDSNLKDFNNEYELLLQYYFWKGLNDSNVKHEPELYITGSVGCGKSTFVDYYIRHFCPERGLHSGEFDKKLCVYFDARGLEYHKEANESFYQGIQSALEEKCKEYNIELPEKSRGGSISRAQETLKLLSNFCQRSKELRYLVLVLDNLDNCSISVQRQVIRYAQEIRKYDSINLYRIIIPLWPTTYDKFAETTEALTIGKPRISLGPPSESGFIKKRLDVVRQQVIEGTKLSIDSSSSGILDDIEEFQNFVNFVFKSLQEEQIGVLIRELCNGDLRRELWLWEGILRSAASHSLYKMYLNNPSRKYNYEWMESLFAGDRRTRDQQKGRIANLFTMQQESISPRSLLAGFYGCQLLVHCVNRKGWYSDMIRLGYDDQNLETLEIALRKYNLLHPIPADYQDYQDEDFEVHLKSLDAYLSIFGHPAYVDNMSMRTPVDSETENKIKMTVGHLPSDLQRRVLSSVAFIQFISIKEHEFRDEFNELHGNTSRNRLSEQQWLEKKKIQTASYVMAENYIERLEGLIKSKFLPKNEQWVEDCIDQLWMARNTVGQYIM